MDSVHMMEISEPKKLVIAAGAEWFKLPGRPTVLLETRIPLRRLLLALGEQRLRNPNAVMPVTTAFEAGWPGERATATAAAMRVYTAVHTLRRMGLRGMLVRRRRGYVLDIDCEIATMNSQFPPAFDESGGHESGLQEAEAVLAAIARAG
jgi:hypothetical protein